MKLNPVQAAKAYDSVRDTFSKIGVPTEEQAKAYIAMLSSTASFKEMLRPDRSSISPWPRRRPGNWRRRNSAALLADLYGGSG